MQTQLTRKYELLWHYKYFDLKNIFQLFLFCGFSLHVIFPEDWASCSSIAGISGSRDQHFFNW